MTKVREVSVAYPAPSQLLSTVTARGQTTIPHQLRERYRVQPRTKLRWIDTGRGMLVVPVPDDPIKAARGMLADRRTSTQAFLTAKEEEMRLVDPLTVTKQQATHDLSHV